MQLRLHIQRLCQPRLVCGRTHILTVGDRAMLLGLERGRHPHPVSKTSSNALPTPVNVVLLELKSQGVNGMISQYRFHLGLPPGASHAKQVSAKYPNLFDNEQNSQVV